MAKIDPDREILNSFMRVLERETGNTLASRMRCAMNTELTERQRQMVTMHYFDGMRQIDIARKLGLDPSTVSRTLNRARVILRRTLRYGGRSLLSSLED